MRRSDIRFYTVMAGLVLLIYLATRLFRGPAVADFRKLAKSNIQIVVNKDEDNCQADDELEVVRLSKLYSVSVIISAHPLEDSVISQTVYSVIAHSDPRLLKEVIISDHGRLKDDHMTLLRHEFSEYESLIKLMSSPSDKRLKNKLLVGHAAAGNVVLYMDDTVVASDGFLVPLLQALEKHPERIVVPSFTYGTATSLTSKNEERRYKWVFDWGLQIHPYPMTFQEMAMQVDTGVASTVAFDSSAFSLHKAHLEHLGTLKLEMEYINSVDLSFASWLCGDGVYIVFCSRVAHTTQPPGPSDMKDRHKIASQYMTEKYLTHFNRVNKEDIHLDQADKQKININNGFTKKNCPKDFDWFMENIARRNVYVPSKDTVGFGSFVSTSGRVCFKLTPSMIFLGTMDTGYGCYDKTVELLSSGELKVGDECLVISDKGYIVPEMCVSGSPKYRWERTQLNQFVQREGTERRCISHASDPYPENKKRQVLMYTHCATADEKNRIRFQAWNHFTWL